MVHASPEFKFDLSEFRSHPFRDRLPEHDESPVSCTVARMCETEEVERFWLSLATPLAVVGGKPPKLDQACLVGMQFQAELVEAFPQVFVKLLGIRAVLEAQHNVVGESHHDNVTARVPPAPLIGPPIEHVMQVHIRKYG